MSLVNGRLAALLLACVACLLQSCGGGGSSGNPPPPPPPPPPPTELISLVAVAAPNYAAASFYSAEDAYFAMHVLSFVAQELQDNELQALEFQCSESGAVNLSAEDANGNGTLNAGDRVFLRYVGCNDATGEYSLDIEQVGLDAGVIDSLAGDLEYHVDFIGTAALSGEGRFNFRADAASLIWNGTRFRTNFTDGLDNETLLDAKVRKAFNQDGTYSFSFSGVIDSSFIGGRFLVETSPRFDGAQGQWPTSGMLIVTGRDDSEIRYGASSPTAAVVEVDADGDGILDDLVHEIDWIEISSGYGFGASANSSAGVPPPSTGPDLLGRRIPLEASAKDLAVNPTRGHIYVTIPSENELLVFSAETLEVVRRVNLLSRPTGLSVAADGSEIFVGLAASGSISVLHADTFAESRIFVAPELESSEVYKVVETAPGVLYVGTGTPDIAGHIARVDRSTGIVTPVVATAFGEVELLADPAHGALYAADGLQSPTPTVRMLDASDPASPVRLSAMQEVSSQFHRMSLDPMGSRLFLASGRVLDTGDFSRVGDIYAGVPWVSNSGTEVFVAHGERDLHIFSTETLGLIDSLETDCWQSPRPGANFTTVQRMMQSPINGQWLLLGDKVLCVVDLVHPDMPPGTGEPGVLPEPFPVVTVATRRVHWSNTIFDAAYDDVRKRLYVTLHTVQELVTIDAENALILSREALGHTARGVALSPDGSTLAIMFNDNGNIAFKDLTSGQIETRDLTALLGTPAGYDVAWLDNDILYASAAPPCCDEPYVAYLARVSRSDPTADRRSADGANNLFAAELAIGPDGQSLFLNRGTNEALKLDLTLPNEPIAHRAIQSTGGITTGGFHQPSLSPDGSLIAYSNGRVLRTIDLAQVGEIHTGKSVFSPDGTTLYGSFSSFVDRFDATTFRPIDRLEPSDNCQSSWKLLATADGEEVINAYQTGVCFFRVNEPALTSMRVKAHDSYICGKACLVRRHRREMGATGWRQPSRSHPSFEMQGSR